MTRAWVEQVGARVCAQARLLLAWLRLAAQALALLAQPSSYNRATWNVVVHQIYFTAVQVLPQFLLYTVLVSALLVSIIVDTARAFGLAEFATAMTLHVLVLELLPFLCALFVALRSGAAINTEVALMQVQRELDAYAHCGIDPLRLEFMPRVVAGVLALLGLAGLSGLLALAVAFLVLHGLSWAALPGFGATVAASFDVATLLNWLLKCVLFGLAVTVIPIVSGLNTPRKHFWVPVSVLQGMMRVFAVILLIQVLSLALNYT